MVLRRQILGGCGPQALRNPRGRAKSEAGGFEIAERDWETGGFGVPPKRCNAERTFAWSAPDRRWSNGYEHRVRTSETVTTSR